MGTQVRSMWGGTIVEAAWPTSFGSAFGISVVIDHDDLPDGSPGGWGLYAHLESETVTPGQRVEAGTPIGTSGSTGNSTGPHLHVGVYMQPYWSSGGGVDPQRWFDAGESGGSSSGGTVYLSKLHYGQDDSDSVRHLQRRLNEHPLQGGTELPVTGGYFDMTDAEVIKCQVQHGFGDDPPGQSYVGAGQSAHLFDGTGITVVDDS
jgi:murein DD-endopeptidase MepM/ murein hydrolase activator NlpD